MPLTQLQQFLGCPTPKAWVARALIEQDILLIDTLIVGAFVEARSCERFELLIPYLDDTLSKFYASLVKSEARHYEDYLALAKDVAMEPGGSGLDDFYERIELVRALEVELVCSQDPVFRFHSGVPMMEGTDQPG